METPETQSVATTQLIETQITAIVVYTNRAMVTRRGIAQLTGAETTLEIASLPQCIQPQSIRVSSTGEANVRILGIRLRPKQTPQLETETIAQLTQTIQDLEAQQRTCQDKLAALQQQLNFVTDLGKTSVEQFACSIAQRQIELDQTRAFLDFIGDQYDRYAAAIAEHEQEKQACEHKLQDLRQHLQTLRNPKPQGGYRLAIAIDAAGPGDVDLEVSYGVTQASWTPLYDIRVPANGDHACLNYLAEIQQTSGEDWNNVCLVLSTAHPGLGTLPPKLTPWYIDVPRANGSSMGSRSRIDPILDSIVSLGSAPGSELPANIRRLESESARAEVVHTGQIVTFHLDHPNDIPSDGNPHKITILAEDYPCRLEHTAIPKLVNCAYLRAHVTNPPQGAVLLPGSANIFCDQTFIGTTELGHVFPGQTFPLDLGIDERLKLERDLVEREVDKHLIGNLRRTTFAYRITITNLRDRSIYLTLTEQLPVSCNEQIKVRLTRTEPQTQVAELGILDWEIVLPAQTQKEFYYQFILEHPPDLTVVGLNV